MTYYLVIEKAPALKELFPSFVQYVLITCAVGIPVLITMGYMHWKRSAARKAEIDISYETDPYKARTLVNTEILLKMNMQLLQILLNTSISQQLSKEEIQQIKKTQQDIAEFLEKRSFSNKLDLRYIKTETQEG